VELNGTLHEYLLADVFQLLAQQKATGKLEVRNGNRIGFMILNEGMIVAAREEQEGVITKLATGMRILRRLPERDLEKMLSSATLTPSRFVHELTAKKLISEQELGTAARATLEDISCNLFSWSQGTYRFDPFDAVRMWMLPGVMLPADAVVMEAMRRDDESKRLFGGLTQDIILVPTGREHSLGALPRDLVELFQAPHAHVLSMVDGLTSVAGMVEQSCLCDYRIKETLVRLQQEQLVTALPEKLSQSIRAAMGRERAGFNINLSSVAISTLATVAAVAAIGFIGVFGFQRTLMRSKLAQSLEVRAEIELHEAKRKVSFANLQYHAEMGKQPSSVNDLVAAGYLTEQDIAPLQQTQGHVPGTENRPK
jgi:hypothetical protein